MSEAEININKKFLECDIVAMGILSPDHDGIGTAFTPFTMCVQGIGDTQGEAMRDALEMASQIIDLEKYDLTEIDKEIKQEEFYGNRNVHASDYGDDFYYYAAFRWLEDE